MNRDFGVIDLLIVGTFVLTLLIALGVLPS